VDVEGVGHHVRPLLHQLDLVRQAGAGDAVLDDGVGLAADRVGHALPPVEVDARELAPVVLHLLVEVVDPVVVADAGAGADSVDVLPRDRVRVLDRRHERVTGIRHRRVHGHCDHELFHASSVEPILWQRLVAERATSCVLNNQRPA
jgi:hypothetical protein